MCVVYCKTFLLYSRCSHCCIRKLLYTKFGKVIILGFVRITFAVSHDAVDFKVSFLFPTSSQNDFNMGLDLSEARASLMAGDIVELNNATSNEPTTMKLSWDVSIRYIVTICNYFVRPYNSFDLSFADNQQSVR